MEDPTQRPSGAWPGDRPIRWGGVARGLAWFVVGRVALIAQVLLAVPVYLLATGPGALPVPGPVLGLVWGALTLFAAWSWVLGRWRVVLAPVATIAVLLVALLLHTMY